MTPLSASHTRRAYTKTTGKPEFIQVGLKYETAHFALNEAAERSRAGLLKVNHREADIIGNVNCIFRPVEERWTQRLMYRAQWFYEEQPFPALQCIYPDLENRFPWEQGFDASWRQRQALLFAGVEWTDAEWDLWIANDRTTTLGSWKWPDPPHTMACVRSAVAKKCGTCSRRLPRQRGRRMAVSRQNNGRGALLDLPASCCRSRRVPQRNRRPPAGLARVAGVHRRALGARVAHADGRRREILTLGEPKRKAAVAIAMLNKHNGET